VRKLFIGKIAGLPDFIIISNNPKKMLYPTSSRGNRDGTHTSRISLARNCGDYEIFKREEKFGSQP